MSPAGDVGKAGIRAYAARAGKTEDEFVAAMGSPLTAQAAGSAVLGLVLAEPDTVVADGYLLTPGGLRDCQRRRHPARNADAQRLRLPRSS